MDDTMPIIKRALYLDKLDAWRDHDVIKVVSGVRRCGKSTLMELWKEHLSASGVPESNIVHLNLELLENEHLLEYHALHDEVLRRCSLHPGTTYVILDEIQNIPDFQKAVDSLYVRPNIDLYITGSNSKLLRGTLATLLSGRYVEIEMLPLSFAEYLDAFEHDQRSPQRAWSDYLHDGSLPAITSLAGNDMLIYDYLLGILNTVLLKDVAERLNVSNTANLSAITTYMLDNIGNLTTAKGIADAMTSAGNKISSATVSDYLQGLCASYLLYEVDRYDIRGKRLLKQEKKYYAVDMGIRRITCSNSVRDTGRILENIVYLELKRREGKVFVGKAPTGEVDFITNGASGMAYYQVAETVSNPKTLERELASLQSIRDNHPKYLITLDDTRPISHDGIRQTYALDWLLEREGHAR